MTKKLYPDSLGKVDHLGDQIQFFPLFLQIEFANQIDNNIKFYSSKH